MQSSACARSSAMFSMQVNISSCVSRAPVQVLSFGQVLHQVSFWPPLMSDAQWLVPSQNLPSMTVPERLVVQSSRSAAAEQMFIGLPVLQQNGVLGIGS